MYFQSLNDADFNTFGSLPDLETPALGTNARAEDLYQLMSYGTYFQLNVGDKPMFFPADLSPLDYLNQFDGVKLIQLYVDGVQTRDVQ